MTGANAKAEASADAMVVRNDPAHPSNQPAPLRHPKLRANPTITGRVEVYDQDGNLRPDSIGTFEIDLTDTNKE